MLEYLKLKNVGPAPELEMRFGPRLNLITGDNGLGKSFLLDVAWWALTRRWPQEVNASLTSGFAARPTNRREQATIDYRVTGKDGKRLDRSSRYQPREEAWSLPPGRPHSPGLVLYAHADGGFSVWDPARNYWRTRAGADPHDHVPAYVFSPSEVWNGLDMPVGGRPTRVCNGLLSDWAAWLRERGVEADWVRAVLGALAGPDDAIEPGPMVRLSINDARDIPSLNMPYADAVPILYASSGMRRVAALAYMLIWSFREHGIAAAQLGEEPTKQVVLLVDEVESHLHPRWQRSIIDSLLAVADRLHAGASTQLLAATHSPLVLASAEPRFDDEQDAWFDIDLERDGSGMAPRLRHRTFVRQGAASNWLTSEAFDLKQPRSRQAEAAIEAAKALLMQTEVPLDQARGVDADLRRACLPDTEPFMGRWACFLEELEARSA